MRIVIVEDELKIRSGMAKLITSHTEHQVVGEAKNGREGLEMILHLRPELVISDIRMPVLDGLAMMEELNRLEVRCHVIILSGYSEFEYARQAIRCGADDYLLKPLAAEDVIEMLGKIQAKLEEEERQQAETTEGFLRNLLIGGHSASERVAEELQKAVGFPAGQPMYLLAGYLGDTGTRYSNGLEPALKKMDENLNMQIYYVRLANLRQIFCLISSPYEDTELREKLERRLFWNLESGDRPVWTMALLEGLEQINSVGKNLMQWQSYGMTLGYRRILTRELIQPVAAIEGVYPKQQEGKIRSSICNGREEELRQAVEEFKTQVSSVKCAPQYYRRSYGYIVHFIGDVLRDTDSAAYRAIQSLDAARTVAEAVTLGELEHCLDRMVQVIADSRDSREDIRNYTILRAINFIKEHYQENISLEQAADYLNMTPEYLSTLFNKEVGINFTQFLKRFRISHAKRLLKGTDMKIYEIAEAAGYHDSKYFNRVFKEEVGISPGDYRK